MIFSPDDPKSSSFSPRSEFFADHSENLHRYFKDEVGLEMECGGPGVSNIHGKIVIIRMTRRRNSRINTKSLAGSTDSLRNFEVGRRLNIKNY